LAGKIFEILPTGLNRKARYTHPEGSSSGTWSGAFLVSKVLIPTRSARELHNQTFSHEVGAMEGWNDIARVHGIFVLDEAEAVHEFDFCNLAGAMGLEMSFNIGLCGIAR
jgi:hypothetical protein